MGGTQAGRRSWRAGAFGACGKVGWQGGVLGGVCARRVVVRGLAATGGDACGRNQPVAKVQEPLSAMDAVSLENLLADNVAGRVACAVAGASEQRVSDMLVAGQIREEAEFAVTASMQVEAETVNSRGGDGSAVLRGGASVVGLA